MTLGGKEMKSFIKEGIKGHYIDKAPKKGQLYFLYKLIMNRKNFVFTKSDILLDFLRRYLFCCCKNRCPQRFSKAERRSQTFSRGKQKLTRDLDIVNLIKREQMHTVNKQILYAPAQRFFLQYQRRNVIESNDESENQNREMMENSNWQHLLRDENRENF